MTDITTPEKKYAALKIEKKPGSLIEISAEIPTEVAHIYRIKSLKRLSRELELPGFRKGHVPEEMAMKHIGETALMQETAELALGEVYAEIVQDQKLDVIGRPNVTITKLAPGNPIGFKIESAVYPDVVLPDFKKIAEAECKKADDPEKVEVTEADVDAELKRLQEMMTPKNQEKPEGVDAATNGEEHEDTKNAQSGAPEINDAFAQMLGDFKDLADLKEKIKKGMLMDKKNKAYDRRRLAIADAILAKTDVETPGLFVEGELDQMLASFEERVERAGMRMEEYLKQVEKTVDDLRKEWKPDAEKRAKLQLTVAAIAKQENIEPDAARLDREVKHMQEHYPDADASAIRAYAHSHLTNGLVFALLEGRKMEEAEEEHNHDHTH